MKFILSKLITLLLVITIGLSSCVSKTVIASEPSGAKVYIDDEYVGDTPYVYEDTKISGTVTDIRLSKEGYKDSAVFLQRDGKANGGAIAGGVIGTLIFFPVGWLPFLWVQSYDDKYTYDLEK